MLAVVLSPWLFGSAEPWAWLFVCLLVNFGAAAWLLNVIREGYVNHITAGAAWGGMLILAFTAFQAIPFPSSFVHSVNPLSAEAQITGARILDQMEEGESQNRVPPSTFATASISASAAGTRRSLYLLASLLFAFLALTGSVTDREEVEVLSVLVVLCGFAMAIFAIIQDFSGTHMIYWFHKPRLGGTMFGPFTNRNHFATWMNMCIGLALALILAASRHALTPRTMDWHERMALLSSRKVNFVIMLSYGTILMASAVFLSLSRGGIASLVAAAGLLLAMTGMSGRHKSSRSLIGLIALWALAMVAWLGWRPVFERLGSLTVLAADPLHDTRMRMTATMLRMWMAAPLLGQGFGSFEHVFPLFQGPSLQFGRFVYGHNDFAQLLVEGGLIGAAIHIFVFLFFVRAARRGYSKASRESQLFVVGLTAGLVAVLLHSAVDFGLRRPANALLLVFIAALCLIVTRLPGYGRSYMYETGPSGLHIKTLAVAAFAGLVWLTVAQCREWAGELAFARFVHWQKIASAQVSPEIRREAASEAMDEADEMIRGKLMNPDAHLEVLLSSLKNAADPDLPADLRIRLAAQAQSAGMLAVTAAPSDYEYWLWLSRALRVNGRPLPARIAAGRAKDLAPPGAQTDKAVEALY